MTDDVDDVAEAEKEEAKKVLFAFVKIVHKTHRIRETTMAVWNDECWQEERATKAAIFLRFMLHNDREEGWTDRELKAALGWDINSITGRRNDLMGVEEGVDAIEVIGYRKRKSTNKDNMVFRVASWVKNKNITEMAERLSEAKKCQGN